MAQVTKQDVADIARKVAQAHAAGQRLVTVAGVEFDTVRTGYCARFIRQSHEAALGLSPFDWPYAAANARSMEQRLRIAGKLVAAPEAGDIVAMNRTGIANGHIGLYVGDGRIAHNTSSSTWGPGTVTTRLSAVLHLISGYYAVLPAQAKPKPGGPRIIGPDGAEIKCAAREEQGVMRCDLRPLAEALGQEVHAEHLSSQGKVYLKRRA